MINDLWLSSMELWPGHEFVLKSRTFHVCRTYNKEWWLTELSSFLMLKYCYKKTSLIQGFNDFHDTSIDLPHSSFMIFWMNFIWLYYIKEGYFLLDFFKKTLMSVFMSIFKRFAVFQFLFDRFCLTFFLVSLIIVYCMC